MLNFRLFLGFCSTQFLQLVVCQIPDFLANLKYKNTVKWILVIFLRFTFLICERDLLRTVLLSLTLFRVSLVNQLSEWMQDKSWPAPVKTHKQTNPQFVPGCSRCFFSSLFITRYQYIIYDKFYAISIP